CSCARCGRRRIGGQHRAATVRERCWPGRSLTVAARTHLYRHLSSLMPEVYVSTDVETDGPIPGPNSMLSFASAAYLQDKTLVGTFTANLETLPGAPGGPGTGAWCTHRPQARA